MPASFPLQIVITALDRATEPLRRINSRIAALTSPFKQISQSFGMMGGALGIPALVSGIGQVGVSLSGVATTATGLGIRFAGLLSVAGAAFYAILKGSTDAGDALAKTADRAGLTVQMYSELEFAAGRAGVAQEAFGTAVLTFNSNLGKAQANQGKLYSFLKKTSPEFLRQLKAAKDNSAAIEMVFKAAAKLDVRKRAALLEAAFGKQGGALGIMVKNGVTDIEKLREEYRRLSGDQEKFAPTSEVMNDVLGDMGTAFEGVRRRVFAAVAPVLIPLFQELTEKLAANRERIGQWAAELAAKLPGAIDTAVKKFREFRAAIGPFMDQLGALIEKLGGVKAVAIGVALIIAGPFIAAIFNLSAAIINLGMVAVPVLAKALILVGMSIFDFVLALRAGYGAMAAFNLVLISNPIGLIIAGIALLAGAVYLIYKNWAPIKKFFSGIWDGVKDTFSRFIGWVKGIDWVGILVWPLKWALQAILPQWMIDLIRRPGGGSGGAGAGPTRQISVPNLNGLPGGTAARQKAEVTVNFNNVPSGVRIKPEPGGNADLSLNTGYAMPGAQ